MSGFKMDCPSCGLILTTPNPVPAGTLVNCPKCGTCFGVPALETKTAPLVPVAQAVAAPTAPPGAPAAVPAATPVTPQAAPAVARARAKAPRTAASDDSWFPELDTSSPRVRPAKTSRKEVETKTAERPLKKGKRRSDNAPLIWSLVVAGAVVVIGGGVAAWKFAGGPPDSKAKAAPIREGHRTAGALEKADAASPPERKAAAAAPAAEKRTKTAADKKKATGKKDKTTEKKKDGLNYDDTDEPKPIPGVQTPGAGKK